MAVSQCPQRRQCGSGGDERRRRGREHGGRAGIAGTSGWSGERGRAVLLLAGPLGSHHGGHGAVVRAVPPATGRQVSIVTGLERGRERPEPKEQDEQDGETAAHLTRMLHEECFNAHTRAHGLQAVRYHRSCCLTPREKEVSGV